MAANPVYAMDTSDGRRRTRPKNEDEYRRYLDEEFKPRFANFPRGIPNLEMMKMFQYEDFGLPKHKLRQFLMNMDRNKDGFVTYQEFYKSMIRKREKDLSVTQRSMLKAILAVNPTAKRKEHQRRRQQAEEGVSVDMDDVDGHLEKEEKEVPESYLEMYNCRPPPIFMPLICIAQIIAFIIYGIELKNRSVTEPSNVVTWTSGLPYWSPLIFDPARRYEAWRYFSYLLIHQGIHHILFNICLELLLGIPLEIVNKGLRVGGVFIIGVLAGSLASTIGDPTTLLCGSSGGCYALIGAHFALVLMNWEELQYEWTNCRENPLRFVLSGVVRLIFLLILVFVDFGVAIYQRYGLSQHTKTSFAAHIGGLFAGILIGIPLLKNPDVKMWEKVFFWIAIVLLACAFTFAVFWNIFYTGFPTPT